MQRRLLTISVLFAGLALGAVTLSPVAADIGTPRHLWRDHIRPKADKRYVRHQGPILVTVHPIEWTALGPSTVIQSGLDVSLLSVESLPGSGGAGVSPDLPTALYGKRMRLVEVQFCYDATDADVTLTQFLMRVDRNETGTTKTNPVVAAADVLPHSDEACRTYPVDFVLTPHDMAAASVSVDFGAGAGAGTFEIGRLTFVLRPTRQAA